MKIFCGLLSAACLWWLAATTDAQTNVVTDPVGFVTVTINGTNTSPYTYLGLSLTQPVAYQSKITAANGTQLTDSSANWTNGQFSGTGNAYFIELTSGPGAGITDDVISNTSTTLTTASDLSSMIIPGTTTYKLRKHWTIGSVFGTNNEIGLAGGSSASTADNIILLDPETQVYYTYYYRTNSPAGWRRSTDMFTDASNTILYMDQGIWIKRKLGSSVSTKLVGAVKLGQTLIPISANQNIVANVYPVTNLTLATSNLYTGSTTNGFAGGSTASTADTISIWNGISYDTYYYRTNSPAGWRRSTDMFTDVGNTVIPMGGSVRIRTIGGHSFNWTIPQPFNYPE